MAAWWHPFFGIDGIGPYANALILIPIALMIWFALGCAQVRRTLDDRRRAALAIVTVTLFLSYSGTILILRTTVAPAQLDSRMFSPLVVIIGVAMAAVTWRPSDRTPGWATAGIVAWIMWIVLLLVFGYSNHVIQTGVRLLPISSADGQPSGIIRVGMGSLHLLS
jgi:hypothetical protein